MASGKTSLMMQETQEMHVRPLGWEDPLEKGMATYAIQISILFSWDHGPLFQRLKGTSVLSFVNKYTLV